MIVQTILVNDKTYRKRVLKISPVLENLMGVLYAVIWTQAFHIDLSLYKINKINDQHLLKRQNNYCTPNNFIILHFRV